MNNTSLPDPVSLPQKLLAYIGLGPLATRAHKSLVSVIWNIGWGAIQFVTITVLLFLIGLVFTSPTKPGVSEWSACDRPLGIWAAFWLIRVLLASVLAYWEHNRERQLHPAQSDVEAANPTAGTNSETRPNNTNNNEPAVDPLSLPYTHVYTRLTLISSFVTLIWFVTANVLIYTSINTCRFAAPRLWWLNFAILSILYLMILEVIILGFVVLIVAPILFVIWNIVLICTGRHPMQNPNAINPDIGKLSKAIVDRIPLVFYIPSPPTGHTVPQATEVPHDYPPSKPLKQKLKFKLFPNFMFLRSKPSGEPGATEHAGKEGKQRSDSWADNWEQCEFPFVTLDSNRATCPICLNDFEEPPKKLDGVELKSEAIATEILTRETKIADAKPSGSGEIASEAVEGELNLEDAGSGPQPLRLLGCEHVFHKSCLDPWLMDVSGRCPVCQRPIERNKPHKSHKI